MRLGRRSAHWQVNGRFSRPRLEVVEGGISFGQRAGRGYRVGGVPTNANEHTGQGQMFEDGELLGDRCELGRRGIGAAERQRLRFVCGNKMRAELDQKMIAIPGAELDSVTDGDGRQLVFRSRRGSDDRLKQYRLEQLLARHAFVGLPAQLMPVATRRRRSASAEGRRGERRQGLHGARGNRCNPGDLQSSNAAFAERFCRRRQKEGGTPLRPANSSSVWSNRIICGRRRYADRARALAR